MGFTREQIKLAQECKSAEELVEKSAAVDKPLTLEEAQKFMEATNVTEIKEEDLDYVASGGCHTCSDAEEA